MKTEQINYIRCERLAFDLPEAKTLSEDKYRRVVLRFGCDPCYKPYKDRHRKGIVSLSNVRKWQHKEYHQKRCQNWNNLEVETYPRI
jgi:hypothetical protein